MLTMIWPRRCASLWGWVIWNSQLRHPFIGLPPRHKDERYD
jgi:hypothetical protein